jgi:hypothetical protein
MAGMGFKDSMLKGRIDALKNRLRRTKLESPEYLQIKTMIEEAETQLKQLTESSDQNDRKGFVQTLFSGQK